MIRHFPKQPCCQLHLADFDVFIYSHFHAQYFDHIFLICYCVAKNILLFNMAIHINGRTGMFPARGKSNVAIRRFCFTFGPMFIKIPEHLNTSFREMPPTIHHKEVI